MPANNDGNGTYVLTKLCNERHGELARRICVCEKTESEIKKSVEKIDKDINYRIDRFNNKLLTIILLMVGNLVGILGIIITIFTMDGSQT